MNSLEALAQLISFPRKKKKKLLKLKANSYLPENENRSTETHCGLVGLEFGLEFSPKPDNKPIESIVTGR